MERDNLRQRVANRDAQLGASQDLSKRLQARVVELESENRRVWEMSGPRELQELQAQNNSLTAQLHESHAAIQGITDDLRRSKAFWSNHDMDAEKVDGVFWHKCSRCALRWKFGTPSPIRQTECPTSKEGGA